MGTQSIISGYIKVPDEKFIHENMNVISEFEFDEAYPFPNIFIGVSPAQYFMPVIGFAGSLRKVEEDWSEWLWKFSQLLSNLEAIEAKVYLNCIMGEWSWTLRPQSAHSRTHKVGDTFINEVWGITKAPINDFILEKQWKDRWAESLPRWLEEG